MKPQLRMIHRLRDLPEPPELPKGYVCREATDADAEQLDALLSAGFGDGWRDGGARFELLDHADVPTTWVVECGGQIVATASYQLKPQEFPESAWVHYVGADAAHSGRGLGLFVTWKVLNRAVVEGRKDVMLSTDDWRLPAIRTYLKLGFEPFDCDESHAERWKAVLAALTAGRTSPATSD